PGLKADLHLTFRDSFQQQPHVFADAKNLIDEVDVLDSPAHQGIDLLQQGIDAAFAEFIAKQSFITKCASPGAPTSKLQLGPNPVFFGKYMMPVPMGLHVVIIEIKWREFGHIRHAQRGTYVNAVAGLEATS